MSKLKPLPIDDLANKLLDSLLTEKKLMKMLTDDNLDASTVSLEAILTSLTMLCSRMAAVHLFKRMESGEDMKSVKEISEEIQDIVSEMFEEYLEAELIGIAQGIDAEGSSAKVKPTSH